MALNLSGTSGITGAGIGTIGPSGANVTGVGTFTSLISETLTTDQTVAIKIGDGTNEKGYIGYNSNDPFIGRKNGVGLSFQNNKVRPVDGDDGSPSNNTVDIGEPTYKFKDLHLAGHSSVAGVSTAKTFVPTEGQLSHRNIMINGAMQVAQRGTTSGTEGYSTIDRFSNEEGSCDEVPTQSQHDLTSSDTGPWAEGFRHSFHIQNGNQTSGAQAANFIKLSYQVEAQDMATSGWNYTSTSSYITLSFWVKSSVAQNFYGRLATSDGTSMNYPFETGSLSANTWTKITKTIPGNANISINNDNGAGLLVEWQTYRGGNTTSSGVALDTWAAYASGTRTPDQTSTWFTTNDATWELTGVQLEVGSVATPFEHRSYGEELRKCQRYYWQVSQDGTGSAAFVGHTSGYGSSFNIMMLANPVEMRVACAALTTSGTAADYQLWGENAVVDLASVPTLRVTSSKLQTSVDVPYNITGGYSRVLRIKGSTSAYLGFSAEL